jgi:hypothetical protein
MSILDTKTTLKEAINNNYYGAWVSKDSIILVVYEECHPEIALQILQEILHIDENKLQQKYLEFNLFKLYSLYTVMYRLGYIRVNFGYNGAHYGEFCAECSKYIKLTDFQRRILNRCDYVEYLEIYKTRR